MNTKQLLKTIFDECSCPCAYVKCSSIFGELTAYADMFAMMKRLAYNGFQGAHVVPALRHNLHAIREICFGREYSPVLYITPNIFSKNKKLSRDGMKARTTRLIMLLKKLGADECWEVNPKTHEIRAWWD